MPQPESHLAETLDELCDLAAEAGLDPAAARDEGLRVAAALAESVPGASVGWATVARPDLGGLADLGAANVAFFEAASRGRRWRAAPTDLLQGLISARNAYAVDYAERLTEVAAAAVMLGTAPIWVITNASATSAAYLAAAGGISLPAPTATGDGRFTTPSFPSVPQAPSPASMLTTGSGSGSAFGVGSPNPSSPSLPPLPGGPVTDAVLRACGYVRDPAAGMRSGPGAAPAGSAPAGSDPAGTADGPAGPLAAASQQPPAETAPEEPAEPEKTVEELLAELDAMIGLDRVKKEIHRQVALLTVERLRAAANLKAPKMSRHLIFVGNPGTGKTTVARLIGAIYKALELLPQGQLVEVDRSELVAGYVGQTAIKTAEVCATAVDGVLFIDEAYALTGDQYAQEAVNTLVKEMEDHRENLVVIVAGYPEPMVTFIAQNPGLASRFTTTIEFDDYTDDELVEILRSIATASDYELTPEAEKRVRMTLEASVRGPAFGNGRFSRNQFEHAVGRHAWRLKDAEKPSRDDLRLLLAHDFFDAPEP
ncbi:MAG: AAA family ATPase, partial [Humibacillus sp.]|nr:AAA family ATPase [Humibacillus sp.]